MAEENASSTNRPLEISIQEALDRWIQPCFTMPYEHIVVRVNDLGEVRLFGLVHDSRLVDEAIHIVKAQFGVGSVYSDVIVFHTGYPVAL
jgi:osmotically-inducible protein OsmY